jgi:hypothetical protein
MATEIITREDLQEFGEKLFMQIKALIGQVAEQPKKWLKSYQVKNILKVSDNTLQTLRDNGTLPFTKIGGTLYYSYEEICKLMTTGVKGKTVKMMRHVG